MFGLLSWFLLFVGFVLFSVVGFSVAKRNWIERDEE